MRVYNFTIAILSLAILMTACGKDKKKAPVKKVEMVFKKEGSLTLLKATGDTIKQLEIEIADNEYERQTGLMYRKNMREDRGMLFVFKDEQPRSFYMKNTKIPLDIIYIAADHTVVNIAKNTNPQDESSVPSNGPAQYVLEVNAGMSERWGIEAGDKILFTRD
ncbi:DUF192 domain-containing protein [Sungkyunkwania multivorans]|uniref:DUF192 domain-containing protein n=1 Tax=Sungkyunkwania multivorans TaxID=1173618 RepID=A0ABW3CTZ4_9FLAO